jgi:16S rRNA (guanine527-N7)-methyltransferase
MASVDIIYKYFPNLTETQKEQFAALEGLYKEWNAQINVVSRKDIDQLYIHHVLHSLSIAKLVEFEPGTDILDVGTGGGFPGIPLAILFPETKFHLVDSIGKKIKVVQNVAEALGLKNVTAEHNRAEKVKGHFDFIVTRAVTRIGELRTWVKTKTKKKSLHEIKNGILALKGGDLSEEILEANISFVIYPLSDYFSEEFFQTKKILHVPLKFKG